MTHHYNIKIVTTNTLLKATYRNKKFIKIELITGKLTPVQIKSIGKIIPPSEASFGDFNKDFQGKVDYTIITQDKTIYQSFVDAWYSFYEGYKDLKPKFNGMDGKHIKQIITYLKRISGTDEAALELWNIILDSWKDLDNFHQENTDLKYINSRLNVIINAIQRKNTGSETGTGKKVEL